MTQYFGFDPGTYQPWALNLQLDALGQPGVARGMQVQPLAVPAMNVQLSLDAVNADGVAFLPNGGWARIDSIVSLGVPNNTSGNLRTDAVVAYVDPTGVSASNISYIAGWGTNFKGNNNQLVLALVNVPNNAVSVVAGNIVNTPLVASAGTAPQNYPDAMIGSEAKDNQGCPPGIFETIEVQITASAANNQTTFTPALTAMQKLVPQGRIGGALETGFFSGPNGWYWPKVRGSVSGLLPVSSVEPVGGNIVTSTGAQSGEAIYLSFRYYDFAQDARVRAGAMFIEKNSPYLVYQGEVVEDTQLNQQQPLWDGSDGAYLLLNPGENIYYIDYVGTAGLPFLGGSDNNTNQVGVYVNGTLSTTFNYNDHNAPGGQHYRLMWNNFLPANPNGPNVYRLNLVAGLMAMPGVRNFVQANTGIYVSGGIAQVQGQPVLLQSTSFALPAPSAGSPDSYVIYTDKYGNITASGGTLAAPADRILGRIPVGAALQYGSPLGTTLLSSSFGQWGLPGSYLGWPVSFVATGNASAGLGTAIGNGWVIQQDSLASYGSVVTPTVQWDNLSIEAVCTGMDLLVRTSGATTAFNVWLDLWNIASGGGANNFHTVYLAATTQYNVRVTLFSGQPYGSHMVKINNITTASAWGIDAVDIRVPATPAAPPGTLPLAQVDVFGYSSVVRPSLARGTKIGDTGNTTAFIVDSFLPAATPSAWLSNNTSSQLQLVQTMAGTGGYVIHYRAGPDKGIISLNSFSIDCYSAGYVSETTALVATGGNVTSVSISSGGQKNASSSGWGIEINGIDYFPWQTHVTDLRRFGVGGGHASELRGSAIKTQLGGRLDDGGNGIRTEQLRDRSITSRKVSPTWKQAVTAAAYSGVALSYGVDPFLLTSITVEVPSLLMVQLQGGVRMPPSTGLQGYIAVNGINTCGVSTGGNSFAVANPTTSYMSQLFGATVMYAVPAGTHLIQPYYANAYYSSPAAYFDGLSSREITVLAFAL